MPGNAESPNIRISPYTKSALRELAKSQGKPMQTILDEAVEQYRRDRFLDQVNAAFAALKSDPKAWKEELDERALWDQTLSDGLRDE
jgi:predicted DNA-binding protein